MHLTVTRLQFEGILVFSILAFPDLLKSSAVAALAAATLVGTAAQAEPIRGAGSTFAAPIIDQWSRDYEAARTDGGDFTSPDWQVDYEPIGSLAGLMRLDQPDIDFAATDAPLSADDLNERGFAQFPIVMGGIAVVVNIPVIAPGKLRLSGPVIADIYLGKITKWSDPAIVEMNSGLKLPDTTIAALHRNDGSGSTYTFTGFLSKVSPQWRDTVGSNTLVNWPHGRGEKGTGGLAALTRATENSIAYLEYGQVVRLGLPYVSIQNQSGAFVTPDPQSFRAGLATVNWDAARGFGADTTNLAGDNAYPMAVVTYAIVPTNRGEERGNRVRDLFRLAFEQGAEAASALGYIPVSPDLSEKIHAYWADTPTGPVND
jgi:phosphate transport system substrate-binding protein